MPIYRQLFDFLCLASITDPENLQFLPAILKVSNVRNGGQTMNRLLFRYGVIVLMTALLDPHAPARAADEPDLIFKRLDRVQVAHPERQACHLRPRRSGGGGRRVPLHVAGKGWLQRLDRRG